MRPYDSVILTDDINETIRAGMEGAIVETYGSGIDVFVVEVFDRDWKTLDIVDVRADQMTVTLSDFVAGERIALLADLPAHQLRRGQVGLIKDRVAPGLYTVAFADTAGTVYAELTLHAGQMLLLHWQPTQQNRQSA